MRRPQRTAKNKADRGGLQKITNRVRSRDISGGKTCNRVTRSKKRSDRVRSSGVCTGVARPQNHQAASRRRLGTTDRRAENASRSSSRPENGRASGYRDKSTARMQGRWPTHTPLRTRDSDSTVSLVVVISTSSHPPTILPRSNPLTEFTIHGLWTDYNDGKYPSCCRKSDFSIKKISSLMPELQKYWPSLSCGSPSGCHGDKGLFWAHESILMNEGILGSNAEKYSVGDIISAIKKAVGALPLLECRLGYLEELQLCFDKNFKGCPRGPDLESPTSPGKPAQKDAWSDARSRPGPSKAWAPDPNRVRILTGIPNLFAIFDFFSPFSIPESRKEEESTWTFVNHREDGIRWHAGEESGNGRSQRSTGARASTHKTPSLPTFHPDRPQLELPIACQTSFRRFSLAGMVSRRNPKQSLILIIPRYQCPKSFGWDTFGEGDHGGNNLLASIDLARCSNSPLHLMAFLSSCRSLLRRRQNLPPFPAYCRSLCTPASTEEKINASAYHVGGGPSFMRGTVFWEPNKPLTIEEFQMPRPKAGELLIKTKVTGSMEFGLRGNNSSYFARRRVNKAGQFVLGINPPWGKTISVVANSSLHLLVFCYRHPDWSADNVIPLFVIDMGIPGWSANSRRGNL
ncbi:Ribonuclease 2 [Platanthera guangdongensis]|uniref:Ribonuclease 2 n=1 Tax=Platanthera guangdongensis TaxID=2320717 RepID=A0ABR2M863_9ASPA